MNSSIEEEKMETETSEIPDEAKKTEKNEIKKEVKYFQFHFCLHKNTDYVNDKTDLSVEV